jgi:transposase-like protein
LPPRTTIYSDSHASYDGLGWMGQSYRHQAVNHSKAWVGREHNGMPSVVHTQTIDGFWGLVKRGIGAVYRQVGSDYLQSYLNEYTFRTNRRFAARPMFSMLVERGTEQVCPAVWETRRLAAAGVVVAPTVPPATGPTDEPW